MSNKNQFDLFEGKRRKEEGIAHASLKKNSDLLLAKEIAKKIALSREDRTCHADLVQEKLIPLGIELGNAAGALFRDSCWVFTGEWIKSKRVTNHASVRRVWKLRY